MLLLMLSVILCSLINAQGRDNNYILLPQQQKTFFDFSHSLVQSSDFKWFPRKKPVKPLHEIKQMLMKEINTLNPQVIEKVLIIMSCANQYDIESNNRLTIIDFSLPASKKRLWIFDLTKDKLLFHSHVSHGIKSGTLFSNYFSNINNSKASSMGVYNTGKSYRGRYGKSLKLYGLDKSFNDKAYNRFIIMHGAWYVEERFIKKYGRPGRSWGCPAVPLKYVKHIIDTIKDKNLLIAYYPEEKWLSKSKFLNCDSILAKGHKEIKVLKKEKQSRGSVLFVNISSKKNQTDKAILAVSADNYARIFKKKIPLNRMLRRQINHTEYIALKTNELKAIGNNTEIIKFIIPEVKKLRGYYATEMKIVPLGEIKTIQFNPSDSEVEAQGISIMIQFKDRPPIKIKENKRFIRWLGL